MSLPSRRRLTFYLQFKFHPLTAPLDQLGPTSASWTPYQQLNNHHFNYLPGTRILVSIQPNKSQLLITSTVPFNLPAIQLNLPETQLNLPEIQLNQPAFQPNHPAIHLNHPEIHLNHPEIQLNHPAIQLNQPAMQLNPKLALAKVSVIWRQFSLRAALTHLQQLSPTYKTLSTPFSSWGNVMTHLNHLLAPVIISLGDLVQGLLRRLSTKLCLSASLVFRTWTVSDPACQLNLSLQPGTPYSRITSIMMNYSMACVSGWISLSMATQAPETELQTIQARCNTWKILINMLPRSFSSELLLGLFQLTYHSLFLPVRLHQCPSQKPTQPEQSQIAHKAHQGSTHGSTLTFTEENIGKSNFQQAIPSKPILQEFGKKTQARKCCFLKLICLATIASLLFARARSPFLLLIGEERSTSTGSTASAIAPPVWDPKELQMQLHGFLELKFLQVLEFPTPAASVTVQLRVSAGVTTAAPMWMTLPLQPLRTLHFIFSMLSLASSEVLDYNHQLLLETLFHQQRSPLSSELNTISRKTQSPFRLTSWPMSLNFFKFGKTDHQPPTDRLSSSLENCFIAHVLLAPGGYSWGECFRLAETQLGWMRKLIWMQIFTWTAGGGQKTCLTGMVFPFWNFLQSVKFLWTPAAMASMGSPLLEVSTSSTMNILNQKFPLRLHTGIFRIWSYLHMLSPSNYGGHHALACPSLARLTMKPQKSSFARVGQKWIVAWSWAELFGPSSIATKWSGILQEYPLKIISYQMPCLDGPLLQKGEHFGRNVGTLALYLRRRLCLVICSSGQQFDVSGVFEPEADAPSVASLQQLAKEFQDKAWAVSTKASKSSEVKMFMKFCMTYGISTLPVSGDDLVLYSCWLVASGHITKYGSLSQYLSAVSTYHKKLGLTCVTPSQYGPLHYTCRGIRRQLASPSRSAKPVTIKILTNLLNTQIAHSSWISAAILTTMKAACSILFFSMVRLSSLLPAYPSAADPARQVVWGNVKKCNKGATFFVHVEKTIQFQERRHVVTLAKKPGSIFCPVMALEKLRDLRGSNNCKSNDLVFQVPVSEGEFRPLCKYEFLKWFVHRLNEMGLDPKEIRPHSFRHGGVNFALMCEENLNMVKVSSGHLSESVWTYCNLPASSRFQVATKMMEALPGTSVPV